MKDYSRSQTAVPIKHRDASYAFNWRLNDNYGAVTKKMKDETDYHMNPNRWHKIGWTFDHYKDEKKLGKNMLENVVGRYTDTIIKEGAEKGQVKKVAKLKRNLTTAYKEKFVPAEEQVKNQRTD